MLMALNETHDPSVKSWVESANDPGTDFPIQNLPLCAFEAEHDGHRHGHLGVAIGDRVLDLSVLVEAGYFEEDDYFEDALYAPSWNFVLAEAELMAQVRRVAFDFLKAGTSAGQQVRRLREKAVREQRGLTMLLPVAHFNYTDFYASIHHARTVGSMFRPENPLLPNYKWVPIGYHGRASSIVVSGKDVKRPKGQTKADEAGEPAFGPCKMLDYELEVGCVIGESNPLGEAIGIGEAREHMAGFCLVNDWSARDMQKWEYQPLGPFLAKNFATSVSAFVVTREALEPFRCGAGSRAAGDPGPMAYLRDEEDQKSGGFDIVLEAYLQSAEMEKRGVAPMRISHGRAFKEMYWTFAQMIAHHTSNGCNLQPGDLLASGTVSGPEAESRGCLLELTWDGLDASGKPKPRRALQLPTGEARTFLADGDTVIFKGYCEREGYRRIGFGECRGRVVG